MLLLLKRWWWRILVGVLILALISPWILQALGTNWLVLVVSHQTFRRWSFLLSGAPPLTSGLSARAQDGFSTIPRKRGARAGFSRFRPSARTITSGPGGSWNGKG
jgi:peptidoglycan/LPS O-acetylase OafA/YrhL